MVNKVSPARMADQVLMVYQANKVQWVIKGNRVNGDQQETMDQEDRLVNVGFQDYPDLTVKASKAKLDKKVKRDQLDILVKMVEKDPKVNQQLLTLEMLLDLLDQGALLVHLVSLAKTASQAKLVDQVLMDFPVKRVQKDLVANLVCLVNRFPVPRVKMVRKVNRDILVNKENQASKERRGSPGQEENKDKRESLDCQIPVFPDETASLVFLAKMDALENLVRKVKKAKMDRKVSEVDLVQLVKLVHQEHLENRDEKVNHLRDLPERKVTKVKPVLLVYLAFLVIKVQLVTKGMQSKAIRVTKVIADFLVNKVVLVQEVHKDQLEKSDRLVKKDQRVTLVEKVTRDQLVNQDAKVNAVLWVLPEKMVSPVNKVERVTLDRKVTKEMMVQKVNVGNPVNLGELVTLVIAID